MAPFTANDCRCKHRRGFTAQVLRAARWPLDGGALAQLYLSLLTYILMDQARAGASHEQ